MDTLSEITTDNSISTHNSVKKPQEGNNFYKKLCSGRIVVREYDITEADLINFTKSPYLSIDTETTGLHLHRDRLCLVQICNHETVILVHYPQPKYDSPNLVKLFSQPMEKLFHFARFDVMSIYKYLGVLCENIVCTRILSKICRTFSERHGLKHLLEEILSIKINKTEQLSYWGSNILTDAQKEYAKKDVIYLKDLYDHLRSFAEREKRWEIAYNMFQVIPRVVMCETHHFDPILLINYN